MSGSIEEAGRPRGIRTFPPEWGTPPGGQYSEERALWVLSHVAKRGASSQAAMRKVSELRMRDLRERIQSLIVRTK